MFEEIWLPIVPLSRGWIRKRLESTRSLPLPSWLAIASPRAIDPKIPPIRAVEYRHLLVNGTPAWARCVGYRRRKREGRVQVVAMYAWYDQKGRIWTERVISTYDARRTYGNSAHAELNIAAVLEPKRPFPIVYSQTCPQNHVVYHALWS